ncbi:MAG: hypothetical protein ACOY4K_08945 [Pseudomonadota bacterium]
MDRTRIAAVVAGELFATESAVETALAQAVGLMRRMIETRRALGLSPATGDPAMRRVEAVVNALGDAQREIVRTHDALDAVRRVAGLPAQAFGPLVKPEGRLEEDEPAG